MTIEDHKSLELAGIVRNICKNLEELVSKVQMKSNIYLDEIKSLKHKVYMLEEAYKMLCDNKEDFKDHFDTNNLRAGECAFCQGTGKNQNLLNSCNTETSGYIQERENTVIGEKPLFSPPLENKSHIEDYKIDDIKYTIDIVEKCGHYYVYAYNLEKQAKGITPLGEAESVFCSSVKAVDESLSEFLRYKRRINVN